MYCITCMVAKLWSKDTFTENSKEFKKEKYYLGILINLKEMTHWPQNTNPYPMTSHNIKQSCSED